MTLNDIALGRANQSYYCRTSVGTQTKTCTGLFGATSTGSATAYADTYSNFDAAGNLSTRVIGYMTTAGLFYDTCDSGWTSGNSACSMSRAAGYANCNITFTMSVSANNNTTNIHSGSAPTGGSCSVSMPNPYFPSYIN